MPNQTVKNDLKSSNRPRWFFSWKATNKIFMYLWAHFIVENLKNIFRANLEFQGCVIFGSEMTHLPWTNLFWYKPLLLPSFTYWHFSLCTQKRCTHRFWSQNGPIFLEKIMNIIFITYWPLLWWKIFKNFLQRIQSSEDGPFFGP